ncbi:MAG: hypothetical protein RI933_913 [Actinomycetota bacterium]
MLLASIPIGILIGVVLGLVGSGGALMSTPLLLLTGSFTFVEASTSALFVVLTSSLLAMLLRDRTGVSWQVVLKASAVGALGAPLGVIASGYVADQISLIILAALLLLAAYLTFTSERRSRESEPSKKGLLLEISLFLFVGFMTGLTGIGGGYILVPVLYLVSGLKFKTAITTSLFVVVFNAAVSLLFRIVGGISFTAEQWQATGVVVAAALVGSAIGSTVSNRLDRGLVQKIFSVLLLLLAALLVYEVASATSA